MGVFWWTKKPTHLKFIGRELTSLAVAFFSLEMLWIVYTGMKGKAAYESLLDTLSSPVWIAVNVFVLGGLLFHSITWFNLAPKAIVLKIGDKQIPGSLIILANYIGWFVISGIIIWYLI